MVKGKDELPAMESENDSTVVQGSKMEALNLISNLGEDVKQSDGKFRFIVYYHIVPFFLFLHTLVESLMTPTTMVAQKGTILIDCLEKPSKNKEIRAKWSSIAPISDTPSSVVLLKRIVTFILKSKQQILREKGGLKPNQKSMAIRQQLKTKGQPSKQMKIREIIDLRTENTTPNQFLPKLSVYPELKQKEILSLLNGKELAKILKSKILKFQNSQITRQAIVPWQEKMQTNRNINWYYKKLTLFQQITFASSTSFPLFLPRPK